MERERKDIEVIVLDTQMTNERDEARDCVYSWMVTKKVQYDFQ